MLAISSTGRWLAGAVALSLAFSGCGADSEDGSEQAATGTQPGTATDPPPMVATAVPPGPPVRDAPVADGQRVFERSGCLACHQLLTRGNSGPGDSLAAIGSRMSRGEIRRALLDSPAPMPSYGDLPRDDLDDLVAYLSALTSNPPGGPPCPDDVDCG